MKSHRQKIIILIYILLFQLPWHLTWAQQPEKTIIKGIVLDGADGKPLPFVSVILKGTSVGMITDDNGKYAITTTVKATTISFSFVGYETVTRQIQQGVSQDINIKMNPSSYAIGEVVVKPTKQKYSNKNNPAVELIDKVIENKDRNRIEGYDYLQYDKYEKTQFAVSKISDKSRNNILFKKFQFLLDNTDTLKQPGTKVLPVFIKEGVSTCYFRKTPESTKEIIRGEKTINFDEYIDNKGVTAYLNYLYQNINIYDNNILFLTNKFLSPIANSAPLFYRYYILDTMKVDDVNCIRLFFEARNKSDFLFQGLLLITQDSTYAIKKIDMNLNKGINIDWVKNVRIVQDFYQPENKKWMLSKDEISINFELTQKILGIFGERSVSYKNHIINVPINDSIFRGPDITRRIDPREKSPAYWEANRQIQLSKTEKGIYANVDSLKKMPAFKHRMDVIMLLSTNFWTLKKFEIGPVGSFISFNPVEGSRLRFGGRTTTGFSKKITFDGFLAYGFTDHLYKWSAGATYSFTPRSIYEFPVKSLKISYQYDTQIPGLDLQFSLPDNIFLSPKRGIDDKYLYNRTIRAEFLNEFDNHFSYTLGFSYLTQSPKGYLYFNHVGDSSGIHYSMNIPEAYINLRYAPNESFYQGKLYRDRMPNKYPVITLKYALGSKLLGNDYDYSRLQLNVTSRFYPSTLGYTDVALEGGKTFGKVPYPLLFIHRANQTFSYEPYSYNLMNFLEFVSDQYVSLNVDHCFNGFFLNKVPFLKRLKFREIVTFKALYGSVSNNNLPSISNNLFSFPTDLNGDPLTFTLDKKPYIEAGVGLSNILRIFRVDLIRRFTYTGNPNVSNMGIRIQFKLDI
jgi:hypothetical protein